MGEGQCLKKAGVEAWKKKRRKEYLEKKRYIEENPIYRDMVLIEIEPCQAETMRVISMAERYVKKNEIQRGQIWCVYDKDSFRRNILKVSNSGRGS